MGSAKWWMMLPGFWQIAPWRSFMSTKNRGHVYLLAEILPREKNSATTMAYQICHGEKRYLTHFVYNRILHRATSIFIANKILNEWYMHSVLDLITDINIFDPLIILELFRVSNFRQFLWAVKHATGKAEPFVRECDNPWSKSKRASGFVCSKCRRSFFRFMK